MYRAPLLPIKSSLNGASRGGLWKSGTKDSGKHEIRDFRTTIVSLRVLSSKGGYRVSRICIPQFGVSEMAKDVAATGWAMPKHTRVPALAIVTALASLTMASLARAQAPDRFEVVSIRPNASGGVNTQIKLNGGRLVVTNGSLKTLIRNAYGLLSFQLAGGPNWLDTDMFDILAETGQRKEISQDQFKLLLQGLLADRFHLKIHLETREEPVYGLLIDKNGSKLTKAAVGETGAGMNTHREPGKVIMKGTGVPISELATNLGNQLGRFVIDRTQLEGHYTFLLEFAPVQAQDSDSPSLFSAVREQLGLKLEPQKAPVEVWVIDRAEKPSEN